MPPFSPPQLLGNDQPLHGRPGRMRRARVLLGAALAFGLLAGLVLHGASLRGLDDEARAVRLLRSRGSLCTPKIVERVEAGVLRVVCADGKHVFCAQPSGDEGLACRLGFEVACWDHEPG
jgi:hypothetical protein